jgi:hypothetical protein
MKSESDKSTVGLTPRGFTLLSQLTASGWFAEETDAYKTAISVAIARGLRATDKDMKGVRTKFQTGQLDKDGSLRDLVTLLVPGAYDRPYAYAERFAEAGVAYIADQLDRGELLADVLGAPEVERESGSELAG